MGKDDSDQVVGSLSIQGTIVGRCLAFDREPIDAAVALLNVITEACISTFAHLFAFPRDNKLSLMFSSCRLLCHRISLRSEEHGRPIFSVTFKISRTLLSGPNL